MTTDYPVHLPESTYPYVVCVSLILGNDVELNLSDEDVHLPFADNYTLKVVKEPTNDREQTNFLKRVSVHLEAFPTDCEAKRAGKMLALSILWVAASKRVTIAFEKWTDDFPFTIRNRTQSIGALCRAAEGRVHTNISLEDFSSIAEKAYNQGSDLPPQVLTSVLTSMEFYTSARMESTERARFIGLMTALEALSQQRIYSDKVEDLLKNLASQLEQSTELAGEENESLRTSLSGRLRELRRESVTQAIRKTLKEYDMGDKKNLDFIKEAYGTRSKILHEGFRETKLQTLTDRLEEVMRQLYSAMIGLKLERPVLTD